MKPYFPAIGFTLDFETEPTYSKFPWYALRQNYCDSVAHAGGVPVCLPHQVELVNNYLDIVDGLIITGGAFDIPPSLYGESDVHETVITKDVRTQFELAITRGALERKMPILGICGGQQLLNVALGGTLIQHIPDSIANALPHEQPNPRSEPGHNVEIIAGTLLERIVTTASGSPLPPAGGEGGGNFNHTLSQALPFPHPSSPVNGGGAVIIAVNSAHHQAVAKPAAGSIVNAVAPDGVIEGIELPQSQHPFCLGVQWHPEYHVSKADTDIFRAFVNACRTYGKTVA